MTAAHDLANELHRQLELAESERDAAVLERDQARGEADAIAASVREFVAADAKPEHETTTSYEARKYDRIAALYAEDGAR